VLKHRPPRLIGRKTAIMERWSDTQVNGGYVIDAFGAVRLPIDSQGATDEADLLNDSLDGEPHAHHIQYGHQAISTPTGPVNLRRVAGHS
jgi:hypothetical protein